MKNKTNIEEDISRCKKIIKDNTKTINVIEKTLISNTEKEELQRDNKAIENILADRERLEKENERLKTKYEANNSKTLLTAENLKELEEHCKRQVQRYETNKKMKEEHLLILELLYSYNQNETKANKYDNLVKEIEEQCKRDIEQARKEYKITLSDRQDGIREEAQNILELLDKEKRRNCNGRYKRNRTRRR